MEIKLESGSKLEITAAPFEDALELYQAVVGELKDMHVNDRDEVGVDLIKNIFCSAITSKAIERCLWKCFARCKYNGLRIVDKEVFEPVEAREDYFVICKEVAMENIAPFTKSLFAEFSQLQALVTMLSQE